VKTVHWESWVLRVALLALAGYQLATGNRPGATVAIEGFVVSLIPLAIERLSKTHVPRLLEVAFVGGITLQFVSESTKLFELFTYWDKIVHPTLVALTALIAAWLIASYAEVQRKNMPVHLSAALALLLGMCVGAMWEYVEFASDWFGDANLQKSNGDTMTDVIANNIGAFVATLVGLWIFTQVLKPSQRQEMGHIAQWLAHGPSRVLDRFGRPIGVAVGVLFAAVVVLSQTIDLNRPALASGLAAGQAQEWALAQEPTSDVLQLSGDWVPDERGVCRVNLEHPKPGSEKMGVLQLGPGTGYGLDGQAFSVSTQYFEERPPREQGTEMDAGIAFGIRDSDNFLLLEQSALHDVLRLDEYVHGRRRDVREILARTHGDEWHTLGVRVDGAHVTALLDAQPMFETDLDDAQLAQGGVGVWARAAAATCFSDAQAEVGDAS
jgi:hypothetical protein